MSKDLALDGGEEQASSIDPAPARAGTDWWAEIRGVLWLVLAVLGFHSLIAKPFYIPSESMLPGLLVGDRLVVTKYPYGYSYITPTFHVLPFMKGRLFGRMPARGDIVIASPPGSEEDYIKRVIGLPGDTIEVRDGLVILNGTPVKRGALHMVDIPVDRVRTVEGAETCAPDQYPGARVTGRDGKLYCRLPIITETLPNGAQYDTVELGDSSADFFGPYKVPAGHVFLMGDNRDRSADSRVPLAGRGLGGAVPWENVGGRAEFITFSVDGSATWNPLTWFTQFRSGRASTTLHPKRVTP